MNNTMTRISVELPSSACQSIAVSEIELVTASGGLSGQAEESGLSKLGPAIADVFVWSADVQPGQQG